MRYTTLQETILAEREEAKIDLIEIRGFKNDGSLSEPWLRGPRSLICDLRVGTCFTTITGKRGQLVGWTHIVCAKVLLDGADEPTTMIGHAAVLPVR